MTEPQLCSMNKSNYISCNDTDYISPVTQDITFINQHSDVSNPDYYAEVNPNETRITLIVTDTTLRTIVQYVDCYVVPFIVAIGLIGNLLSFLVFMFTKLNQLSSSIYLAALAVTDSGFLMCVFFSWSTNINVKVYHTPGWCQFFVYMTYVFGFLSVWYIVGFSAERFIAIRWPFRRSDMCTTKKAKIVVVSLAVFAMLAYMFAPWTSEVIVWYQWDLCVPKEKYRSLVVKLNNIDSVITLVIPFISILVVNSSIIYTIKTSVIIHNHASFHKGRRLYEDQYDAVSASCSRNVEDSKSTLDKIRSSKYLSGKISGTKQSVTSCNTHYQNQLRMTVMLLVVSSVFLFLNVPSHVVRMYEFVNTIIDSEFEISVTTVRVQKLCTIFYYLNFSVNFMLYSLCGKNFRQALVQLLRNVWGKITRCSDREEWRYTPSLRSGKSVISTKV